MRIDASLELAKEVEANSRVFQTSELDESEESHCVIGQREDEFKDSINAFKKLDDFVPQCSIWTMTLNLDGRKLALWKGIWKDGNDAFRGRSKNQNQGVLFQGICVTVV